MRYSRQETFEKIGKEGQEKLSKSEVAVVGLGGTGTAAAMYLAASGVNLRLIDYDIVEESNLARQAIYTENDVGRPKTQAIKERLMERNSSIHIETINQTLVEDNQNILEGSDFVIDGTDNIEARKVINKYCKNNNLHQSYFRSICR